MAVGNNGDNKGQEKEILVDPAELTALANKISELIPGLLVGKEWMDSVEIVPGNFSDAQNFKDTIGTSANGRAAVYAEHLQQLHTALDNLSKGLLKISTQYNSAEEMNKNLVQQLDELEQSVDPYLPSSPSGG